MKELAGERKDNSVAKPLDGEAHARYLRNLCKVTGTTTESGANRILNYMAASQIWGRSNSDEQKMLAGADLIAEYQPANLTEAALAVQIFSVHEAALYFLQRATVDGQTLEGADANVQRANRLLRLFIDQVLLMAKLKGKTSQQKVTVEHVHVHQGGQAIVGAVNAPAPGRGEGGN